MMSEDFKSSPTHLLLVDDDELFRERLLVAMRRRGIEASAAGNVEAAIALSEERAPTHAVIDLRMPGKLSGLDLLQRLRATYPTLEAIVLTGYGSISSAVEALHLGARNYLSKPCDADAICMALGLECAGVSAAVTRYGVNQVPSLPQVEWEHIQRVMQECNGNISKAAKLLGLHRRSLQRKLMKPPIQPPIGKR